MSLIEIATKNEEKLKQNEYPGRGIIIGKTPNGKNLVQIYWIMGRSENSRNRIFSEEGSFVKTEAFDVSKMTDPSLIIYYPAKSIGNKHIISNGDQTDTIYESIVFGKTFEDAINKRTFEPDKPNFTPRISGLVDLENMKDGFKLSIIKSDHLDPMYTIRNIFSYEKSIPGIGYCLHTYRKDGNPLPSFLGEPYVVKIFDDQNENANYYWSILNEENRISLMVKYINIETKDYKTLIINKNEKSK